MLEELAGCCRLRGHTGNGRLGGAVDIRHHIQLQGIETGLVVWYDKVRRDSEAMQGARKRVLLGRP